MRPLAGLCPLARMPFRVVKSPRIAPQPPFSAHKSHLPPLERSCVHRAGIVGPAAL
jgi:hypothetical protein